MISQAAYLEHDHLEWITPDGRLQICLLSDCKALCFVSENGRADLFTTHNLFERRPRVAGLWTRFTFRDGGLLDGVLSPNLLEWPEAGYFAIPPQARATRQRVFIPRVALLGTELRGVVGGATVQKGDRTGSQPGGRQLSMFD